MIALIFGWAAAAALVSTFVQGPPPIRMPRPGTTATQSSTQPISPVAVMTWVTRYGSDGAHSLDLLVVWRGSPGWFMQGNKRGSSSGGSGDTFRETIRYGDLELELTFNASKRIAEIQGRAVELRDANVLLVDHVDASGGPQVVSTMRIDASIPSEDGRAQVAPVLRRSPEVIAFLRCDAPMPGGKGQASIDRLCAQATGKVPE